MVNLVDGQDRCGGGIERRRESPPSCPRTGTSPAGSRSSRRAGTTSRGRRSRPGRGSGTRATSPAISRGSSASPPSTSDDPQDRLRGYQPRLNVQRSRYGQRVGSAGERVGREVPVQEICFRLAPEDLTDHLVVPVTPLGSA